MTATEICTAKGTFQVGEHTEVLVECGQKVEGHGEYHAAGKTIKTGEDGYPDQTILFRWRSEPTD